MKKSKSSKTTKKSEAKDKGSDIINLILEHHQPLKLLIKTMKSKTASYSQKKKAFIEFAPTLVAHAKPEEQSWYVYMKSKSDSKVEGLEGDVEHSLADQLCDELKATDEKDMFLAKVKVLAELVEHHIEEEEEELIPHFKKNTNPETRLSLGDEYTKLRERFLNNVDVARNEAPSKLRSVPATTEFRLN